ncbi:MAG: hypothetical protein AAGB93_25905 [Planctomycetota bacterium]
MWRHPPRVERRDQRDTGAPGELRAQPRTRRREAFVDRAACEPEGCPDLAGGEAAEVAELDALAERLGQPRDRVAQLRALGGGDLLLGARRVRALRLPRAAAAVGAELVARGL